jgi:hypothetical protein
MTHLFKVSIFQQNIIYEKCKETGKYGLFIEGKHNKKPNQNPRNKPKNLVIRNCP